MRLFILEGGADGNLLLRYTGDSNSRSGIREVFAMRARSTRKPFQGSKTSPSFKRAKLRIVYGAALLVIAATSSALAADTVRTAEGEIRGSVHQDSGVRTFFGIPFAQPPVGDLRWKAPQEVRPWSGVRPALAFGPRCKQEPVTTDVVSRAPSLSEDCLYLNVWTPSSSVGTKLPVLVYIYGGGFQAGDGSERRYDGEALAKRGIVVVTFNYRLGVFGFLALPELTQESPQHASGNYGLLDQTAALQWVHKNISAFGGDPRRVTIAGESAGSMSVSAQMASPLARGLFAAAIGESGSALLGTFPLPSLAAAEQTGLEFERGAGADSLAALRALPALVLQDLSAHTVLKSLSGGPPGLRFWPDVDGYFFPKPPAQIFAAGEQSRVPLLAGSNSEENGYNGILGEADPTVENYKKALQRRFHEYADEAFQLYPASGNGKPVQDVAQTISSDLFTGYITWKWLSLATRTGGQPTYYYYYTHPRPPLRPESVAKFKGWWTYALEGKTYPRPAPRGAVHSAEIEYALGNLDGNDVYAWRSQDYEVSKTLESFFVNFIKTGNPNGPGLPTWPPYVEGQRMIIDVASHAAPDDAGRRYRFLETTLFK